MTIAQAIFYIFSNQILERKIQMIDLHLHFDKKNPPNSFEIMFWHENTFEIMFWIWRKNSIEIIIWHENSFEIELISCFHKKGLKKQSGQRLPTTFYIFSNQILEICILTGKIQQIHLRLCFDVKNHLKWCFDVKNHLKLCFDLKIHLKLCFDEKIHLKLCCDVKTHFK